ncbi:MAG: hypothetical protein ACRDNZ_01295 [Streptosporangiaceae bacterium]
MLVTPWFAAGAGFVVAAALSLNSPRTVLTFRPNTLTCETCHTPAQSLPAAKPGTQMKSVSPARIAGSGTAVTLTVGVHIGTERDGSFDITFMLPAGQARHGWKLGFELPGRSITQVLGAIWRPDVSGDGGVAGRPAEGGYVSPEDPARPSFLVGVSGPPVAPTGCVLNGMTCRFDFG